jgi:sporulation-control protein
MVFSKLKAILGSGIQVDTLLHEKHVVPGGVLKGEVRISGAEVDAAVESVEIEFTALVEDDSKGEDAAGTVHDYFRAEVSGKFDLTKGTAHPIPFEVQVPWETPFNNVEARPLVGGMKLGVSTHLSLDQALDKGDLDWLTVEALPVHKAVWEALEALRPTLRPGRSRGRPCRSTRRSSSGRPRASSTGGSASWRSSSSRARRTRTWCSRPTTRPSCWPPT